MSEKEIWEKVLEIAQEKLSAVRIEIRGVTIHG